MLNNKKGQMFTFLLAIFVIIILGTALFLLAQKSAAFNGSIGKQQYGTAKLYYANNKIMHFYESLANDDLEDSIDLIIGTTHKECGDFEDFPFWINGDKNCVPDYLSLVNQQFNQQFPDKFKMLNKPRIFSYKHPLSISEISELSNQVGAIDVFDEDWSKESLMLQTGGWQPPITYILTPLKQEHETHVIATATAPISLEMHDAEESFKPFAFIQQYPNFRLKPRANFYNLLKIQKLPEKIINECKTRTSDQLRTCAGAILKKMQEEKVIVDSAIASQERNVGIAIRIFEESERMDMRFAVKIPQETLFALGPILASKEDAALGDAFSVSRGETITITGVASIPDPTQLTIELCTNPISDKEVSCPHKIFDNGAFQEGAQKSMISQDKKSMTIVYDWSAFPLVGSEIFIRAINKANQQQVESKNKLSLFLLQSN